VRKLGHLPVGSRRGSNAPFVFAAGSVAVGASAGRAHVARDAARSRPRDRESRRAAAR